MGLIALGQTDHTAEEFILRSEVAQKHGTQQALFRLCRASGFESGSI